MARRQIDLALGQIDRALEINPSDAVNFSFRGEILIWAGRAADALSWLEGALRLDSANARATLLLGTAYYFLDRYASPSRPLTVPSPEISDVTLRLRDGPFWRPPTHS